MKDIINFAIVGCGVVSAIHARYIDQLPKARLVAVCNRSIDAANRLAEMYGAAVYSDYNEMFQQKDIDVVAILTPTGTHWEIGIAAARAGKHVIVEKPIDISLEKADALIAACREAAVKLSCIFQFRFERDIIALKKTIDSDKLGQLNFCSVYTKWYRSQEYYDSGNWRGTWALDGGGALMNQGIHYVDLLLYMMGPVEEVFAYCVTRAHERIEVEDIAVAVLKFKSGAVGMIEANTSAYPGFYTRMDVYGNNGSVIVKNQKIEEWHLKSGEEFESDGMVDPEIILDRNKVYEESKYGKSRATAEDTHKYQIQDMIDAINEDREPLVNGEEGRKSLEIILAIYESSRTGKPIKL